MASFLRVYNASVARRPLATGMTTGAVLFGTGDVLAQQAIEGKGRQHDFLRTARLSAYGGLIFAPIVGRWFKTLELVKFKSPALTTVTRVGLDQFVAAPSILVIFFTSMSYMEGHGRQEVEHRLREKWGPTVFKNWLVFIPVQAINFTLVPAPLRLLVINVASLFWNTYLSYANSATHPPSLEETVEAGEATAKQAIRKAEAEVKKIV